jgi:hypothetical protein
MASKDQVAIAGHQHLSSPTTVIADTEVSFAKTARLAKARAAVRRRS